ncbi:LysR family transcriptional regulator [Iningainema tapete]|uniref:LysR family transcriptional regulator n=1 Tax=Iningainema tapete BLCC-T55 TaxID=2748662 RepID=A0A8J6XI16_9CYAN|nr:LysR family transcriptional regulator [Iningainema tapete]MBD2772691.1 LysR family transcriptional regulator [Iningainema tapete BLCC-T55]
MEFRHLTYFVAVAEELHFGRAAKRLYVTQQALSKQIHCLEAELEIQLFYRTKRSCQLTEAGVVFLEEARRLLDQALHAVQVTKRVARGEVGQLKLSFASPALHSVLPKILKIFRETHPDVEVILKEISTLEQVKALLKNEVDVGFLYPPINENSLNLQPILEEALMIVLPAYHPLAALKHLPLEALANEPFILHPRHEGPVLYDQIMSLCEQAGFQPKVVQEVAMSQTRIGWVAAGIGISFVFASLQNLINSEVVYRALDGATLTLQLAAAWRVDNSSPVLQEFLKVTQDLVHQSALKNIDSESKSLSIATRSNQQIIISANKV